MKFILVGGYAGKTVNLGGHAFVDGTFDYSTYLDAEGATIHTSPTDQVLKADFLAKNYQAYPEGSKELEEAQAKLAGGKVAPNAGELDVGDREQKQQDEQGEQHTSDRVRKGAVRTALTKLDPKEDAHWTSTGLPSVEAVRELSGDKEVSRQDIQNLAPKLTREEATKLAADPLD